MVSYYYGIISHYIINIMYAIQSIVFDNGGHATMPSFILDIACVAYNDYRGSLILTGHNLSIAILFL